MDKIISLQENIHFLSSSYSDRLWLRFKWEVMGETIWLTVCLWDIWREYFFLLNQYAIWFSYILFQILKTQSLISTHSVLYVTFKQNTARLLTLHLT
jgi:hypothetical protein